MNNITKATEPKRNLAKNCLHAFIVGGGICAISQIIFQILISFKLDKSMVTSLVATIMVFIGSFSTGFGLYDKLGQIAGCGSIVPITGFANSMSSSALESKSEGLFLGILTNMFKLAGSVIATGVISAFIFGTVRYLVGLL